MEERVGVGVGELADIPKNGQTMRKGRYNQHRHTVNTAILRLFLELHTGGS